MAILNSERACKAARKVQAYAEEVADDTQFIDDVTWLVRAVQDEMEMAHMKGRVRFLGHPYMLYRALEDAVGNERRPLMREASLIAISGALSEYLGLKFTPNMRTRKRRALLPNV